MKTIHCSVFLAATVFCLSAYATTNTLTNGTTTTNGSLNKSSLRATQPHTTQVKTPKSSVSKTVSVPGHSGLSTTVTPHK